MLYSEHDFTSGLCYFCNGVNGFSMQGWWTFQVILSGAAIGSGWMRICVVFRTMWSSGWSFAVQAMCQSILWVADLPSVEEKRILGKSPAPPLHPHTPLLGLLPLKRVLCAAVGWNSCWVLRLWERNGQRQRNIWAKLAAGILCSWHLPTHPNPPTHIIHMFSYNVLPAAVPLSNTA